MKDLRNIYATAILSTFLIKSIRAIEHCTKYLRYVYTSIILSTFLTTATILFTFLINCIRATQLSKEINATHLQPRHFLHSL